MAIFVPKTASQLKNIPAGNISSTNVQAALNELDSEKAPALGADDNYVTDAEKVVIFNTSGTNTGDSSTPAETAATIGTLIGGAGDATPNDTDFVATSLTAGGILKKITWTNVKAFLKTYFDTLYQVILVSGTNRKTINSASILGSGDLVVGLISNLKPVVNASVNKLDIFTKSGGAVPDASNVISIAIPDGNGYTLRTRNGSYLSGTSQFILADATNYWSKGSLAGEIKTAHVYAAYDGTGIVLFLAGYSGFTTVPTTTTPTDSDYFLLEAGSTYTRNASHYCVSIAKIRYEYDTADTPDYTIQATGENIPQVIWNAKSDYGHNVPLITGVTQGTNIAEYSAESVVVKQSGSYMVEGYVSGTCTGAYVIVYIWIKTGSATYGSATQKYYGYCVGNGVNSLPAVVGFSGFYLNASDTIHLGIAIEGPSGDRTVYAAKTGFRFKRSD